MKKQPRKSVMVVTGSTAAGWRRSAEAMAAAFDCELHRVNLSGVVSQYVGETEKQLNRIFEKAEESGAILLFEEADALFGKRSDVKDAHDRYANLETTALLQRIEAYDGLAILATNRSAKVDPAWLCRAKVVKPKVSKKKATGIDGGSAWLGHPTRFILDAVPPMKGRGPWRQGN